MEGGDGDIVSMVDVLEEGNQMEEEAAAVLGDSDDKCCTYPLGYVNRQALYSCVTCREKNQTVAGICLACSYECHEGHEFVELYTKRNFRCDCGNSKFPNMTCKLIKNKAAENTENKYNHNFAGVYCICERPYPDPEDEIEDEMIQCVLCEDWFHGRHLGTSRVPENEDYQEMVCRTCMNRCEFLWYYTVHSLETKMVKEETNAEVDVTSDKAQVNVENETTLNVAATNELTTPTSSDCKQIPVKSEIQNVSAMSDATITSSSTSAASPAITANLPTKSSDGVSSSTGCGNPENLLPTDNKEINNKHDKDSCVTCDTNISTSTGIKTETVFADKSDSLATSDKADIAVACSTDSLAIQVAATSAPESEDNGPSPSLNSNTGDANQSIDAATLSEPGPLEEAEGLTKDVLKRKRLDGAESFTNLSGEATACVSASNDPDAQTKVEEDCPTAPSLNDQRTPEVLPPEKKLKLYEKAEVGEEEEVQVKDICILKELKKRKVQKKDGAVFWPFRWRTKLCSCPECKAMYERLEVSFLQDPEDSVVSYEERGKDKRGSLYGQGMEALSSMNRVQQVEMLHGYQDMKSALSDFLKGFADQGKVVTANDIQEFYESLHRRRQAVGSASAVQYLCR